VRAKTPYLASGIVSSNIVDELVASHNFNLPGNFIKIQREVGFEFRTTRNRIRVVTREVAGYSAAMRYSEAINFQYFTFPLRLTSP
jgi:hypothetical protein